MTNQVEKILTVYRLPMFLGKKLSDKILGTPKPGQDFTMREGMIGIIVLLALSYHFSTINEILPALFLLFVIFVVIIRMVLMKKRELKTNKVDNTNTNNKSSLASE